jgi:hypothetical protein
MLHIIPFKLCYIGYIINITYYVMIYASITFNMIYVSICKIMQYMSNIILALNNHNKA